MLEMRSWIDDVCDADWRERVIADAVAPELKEFFQRQTLEHAELTYECIKKV